VERVTIASRLAEEARKGHSALALAAAAEILAACRTAESKRSKATQGGPGGEQDASASASSLFEKAPQGGQWDEQDARAAAPPSAEAAPDPASLFEEAAAIARTDSNEPLAAAIETAASVSLGGGRPADGRGESHADRIRPHSTDIYVVRFAGGETARATVVTNSGQDVDIFVYDMEDKLVAYDNGLNTTGACSWIPDKSAEYSVRVTNTNGVTVDYTLFTN
jgi:hypothetical protein